MNSVSNAADSAEPMPAEPEAAHINPDGPISSTTTAGTGRRLLAVAFLVGLWAALAGSLILVRTRTYFPIPPVPAEIAALIQPFEPMPPEANDAMNRLERNTAYRNTSLSFAILALATLPLLGVVAGWTSGAPSGTLRGLVTGLVVAVPIGVLAGVGGVTVAGLLRSALPDGDPTILMGSVHAAMWILFSVGIALTIISATTRWNRLAPSLVAAVVAALGASVLYQLGAMVLAPMARVEGLLPDGAMLTGMFAGLGFLLTSLAICYTLSQSESRPATKDNPNEDAAVTV